MARSTSLILAADDLAVNIKSYGRHLRASNYSAKTVEIYLESAGQLEAFLTSAGMPRKVALISREHIEAFITHLLETRSPATANARYRSLQSFFKWLAEEGEVTASPMGKMRPPKMPEHIVPVLSLEKLQSLLRACEGTGFESRRDLAILRLFVTTGAKRREIAELRLDPDVPQQNDIDLDMGTVRVLGKGGRERLLPLDPRTVKALDRYLRARAGHREAATPFLWLGLKGKLTEDGIRQVLEKRAEQAGLGHLHLHQLRHSFAHHYLSAGGNETDLQRLAGWNSPAMLRRYASSTGMERAHEAAKRIGLGSRL